MKLITNLITIFIVFIFCFSYKIHDSSALSDVDWILLKENEDGKEWLDLGSIKSFNNNEIGVLTKFYENPKRDNEKGNMLDDGCFANNNGPLILLCTLSVTPLGRMSRVFWAFKTTMQKSHLFSERIRYVTGCSSGLSPL